MEVVVTVTGWEDEPIADRVVEQAARKIEEAVSERVDAMLDSLVSKAAEDIITERVAVVVDSIITEGWTEDDRDLWGCGNKKVTIREKLEKVLTTVDRYNSSKANLPSIVSAEIRKNFDAEIKAGTERLKAKVSEFVDSTIEETITGDIRAKLRRALAC
jgi:hypothetical protein